jgi:molybdenum cofactor synthesis domain-containing protein
MIVIGNEILSGRTQDKNLHWVAQQCNQKGIKLAEARVIPDIEDVIIATVNECRRKYTYVLTSGGIGPTHDDITTACIAKAFGKRVVRHPEAQEMLTRHYGEDNLTPPRLKMADVPEGAILIPNPVSAAPGFRVENVYVMAGVPSIMQAMFDAIRNELLGGEPIQSRTISVFLTEGIIAEDLTEIAESNPDVDIGSYPFVKLQRLGTSLVVRGTDKEKINTAYDAIYRMILAKGGEPVEEQ